MSEVLARSLSRSCLINSLSQLVLISCSSKSRLLVANVSASCMTSSEAVTASCTSKGMDAKISSAECCISSNVTSKCVDLRRWSSDHVCQ